MKTVLTIAGSDCSGGAGIQADLKTMLANGVYGMSAVTALTAQNTTGVYGIMEADPDFLAAQLDCIFTDIRPDAVKTGMVSSSELIRVIGSKLKEYGAQHIVTDPVMVSTSGSRLLKEDAVEALKTVLLPMAQVITPNIPEAEVLAEMKIQSAGDMERAAEKICREYGCAVLCKGGHSLNDANDLLYDGKEYTWFQGRRISTSNTHGTGCTLSSAIASNLAKGMNLKEAVRRAKNYISGALAAGLDLGKGSGPMDHGFAVKGEYEEEIR
ncbi:MAG TPA: bifunctional hydroxymethylpyrimidine kinase/phosphomethylpyrimidine kinase [Candidatus Lachnoclostridium stercorigallinarum]|uniref:Hydroxymethylpyrimidine/phosphomethylpyrimidine kinase n=1 Tax=Candidatus Lachnoclostridium stercorigallinarum TaxID=2838634 RepID=A0A9D2K699_9FIRM|nr:bifunctional hydroxymethylpyrimidine kinase/phosphomethylpyrimidine kinase [Candidatus Lachnoclostridium stercorigallinarum]